MDDFEKPEWRGQGYKFADLSAKAQGFVRKQLLVPKDVDAVLPDNKLSVQDLVAFKIPPLCLQPASYNAPVGHSFFSALAPSANYVDILSSAMVPPKPLITELLPKANQQWMDGMNSICLPGDSGYVPLWALTVWIQFHLVICPAKVAWKGTIAWLQREELSRFKEDVHSVFRSLSTLSWAGNIVSALPGKTSVPKTTLLAYFSRDWMTDEHVDQMVHLLEMEVKKAISARRTHFLDNIHVHKLLQAYRDDKAGRASYNPADGSFLSVFGSSLTEASQFGGIFHVHSNHWIAIAIDLSSQELYYGDPAGHAPEAEVISALRWFVSQHIPSFPIDQLDDEVLPCPKQDVAYDWFNCALFSYNALLHYFLPTNPLMHHTTNPVFGDLGRLEVLQKLIASHVSTFSDDKALPSEAFKARQTVFEGSKTLATLCPSTPPPKQANDDLSGALKRLSISPKKPAPKKRKVANLQPVIAPIFKKPTLGPKALEYNAKPESERQPFEFGKMGREASKSVKKEQKAEDDDMPGLTDLSDDEEIEPVTPSQGRPRLNILDELTVEVLMPRGQPRVYRCGGNGCSKVWKPRARDRVLNHCKNCLKHTAAKRAMAAAASAANSPGATVLATQSTAVSTTPSQTATTPTPPPTAKSTPVLPRSDSSFFGPRSRKELHQALDLSIVKFICVGRLPPRLVDLPEWKYLFSLQTPSYTPASRTKLMDNHVMSEQEHVRNLQIAELQKERRITLSFDGGSIRNGETFYTVHAIPASGKAMLVEGQECTRESHTGEWIANLILCVADIIGVGRIIAVSSDNTGNTRVAREIITLRLKNVLNLPDPNHHLNNTWKDVASLDYFKAGLRG